MLARVLDSVLTMFLDTALVPQFAFFFGSLLLAFEGIKYLLALSHEAESSHPTTN